MVTVDELTEMGAMAVGVFRRHAVLLRVAGYPAEADEASKAADALEYTIGMLIKAEDVPLALPRTSFLSTLRQPGNFPTPTAIAWMVRRLILGRAAMVRVLPCAEIACKGPEIAAAKSWVESLDEGPSGKSGEFPAV